MSNANHSQALTVSFYGLLRAGVFPARPSSSKHRIATYFDGDVLIVHLIGSTGRFVQTRLQLSMRPQGYYYRRNLWAVERYWIWESQSKKESQYPRIDSKAD